MIQLDEKFLKEFGLAKAPRADQQAFIGTFYQTLDNRVGMRLASKLSERDLEQFNTHMKGKQPEAAADWMNEHFPEHTKIVQEEFNKLKQEIKAGSAQIRKHRQQPRQS